MLPLKHCPGRVYLSSEEKPSALPAMPTALFPFSGKSTFAFPSFRIIYLLISHRNPVQMPDIIYILLNCTVRGELTTVRYI